MAKRFPQTLQAIIAWRDGRLHPSGRTTLGSPSTALSLDKVGPDCGIHPHPPPSESHHPRARRPDNDQDAREGPRVPCLGKHSAKNQPHAAQTEYRRADDTANGWVYRKANTDRARDREGSQEIEVRVLDLPNGNPAHALIGCATCL